MFHMDNTYNVANVRVRGFVCRTNLPSNTAFRGFGGPQAMMVAENWITDVAHSLGKPAEEVGSLAGSDQPHRPPLTSLRSCRYADSTCT